MSQLRKVGIVSFSGEQNEWMAWKKKFYAKVAVEGYGPLLKGDVSRPIKKEKGKTDQDLEESILECDRQVNLLYAELTLSITTTTPSGRAAFRIVEVAQSEKFPNGDPMEAWKALKRRYEPKTSTSLHTALQRFHSTRMRDNQNPTDYVQYMMDQKENLSRHDHEISEQTMIHQVLATVPKMYDMQVELMLRDLETLKIADVGERLLERWTKVKHDIGDKKRVHRQDGELGLAAGYEHKFKGTCYNCGKTGHKATECRGEKKPGKQGHHKKYGSNKEFRGRCWNCNEVGHSKADCPELKKEMGLSTICFELHGTNDSSVETWREEKKKNSAIKENKEEKREERIQEDGTKSKACDVKKSSVMQCGAEVSCVETRNAREGVNMRKSSTGATGDCTGAGRDDSGSAQESPIIGNQNVRRFGSKGPSDYDGETRNRCVQDSGDRENLNGGENDNKEYNLKVGNEIRKAMSREEERYKTTEKQTQETPNK